MQQNFATFDMTEEPGSDTLALGCAFDQARDIGQNKLMIVDLDHTQLRMQGGKGIIAAIFGRALDDAARKVDFPALGKPTETSIGNQS